jgi:hypothetical protein
MWIADVMGVGGAVLKFTLAFHPKHQFAFCGLCAIETIATNNAAMDKSFGFITKGFCANNLQKIIPLRKKEIRY